MSGFFSENKIPLSIIGGAVIIGGFIYLSRLPPKNLPRLRSPSASPTPTSAPVPTLVPTPTPTPAPTPIPTAEIDDTAALKLALMNKTGIAEDNLDFVVNKNTGTHATGLVKEKDAVGGGYWLAAKVGNQWVIVYDGQAQPTCAQIAPYDFPTEMVPQCLDEGGSVVDR